MPAQKPTYMQAMKADGKKKKGKTAKCLFCGYVHPLEAVKARGAARQYEDMLLAVAEPDDQGRRVFRLPTPEETEAASAANPAGVDYEWPYPAVPDEVIPAGNTHTVMASGYGYRRFGDLMCGRQTRSFIETAAVIRKLHGELLRSGVSELYARALASYAASVLCRRLRCSTRGARLRSEGDEDGLRNSVVRIGDLFVTNSALNFQFDFLEGRPGERTGHLGVGMRDGSSLHPQGGGGAPRDARAASPGLGHGSAAAGCVRRRRHHRPALLRHGRVRGCLRPVPRVAQARPVRHRT